MRRAVTHVICLVLALAPGCFGYISQVVSGSTVPLTRVDNAAIQFFVNSQVVAGAQSAASGSAVTVISADSNPLLAIHNAFTTWNAVSTANVSFLPVISTASGINSTDYQMTIAIGATAADVSVVGPALAVTLDNYTLGPANLVNGQLVVCSSGCTYAAGSITDSDIIISPGKSFSTTGLANTYDFQAVMTHEFGHSLGSNHTGILGATMFQYNTSVQKSLSTDDLAFVNATYPSPTSPVAFGTVSGKVTIAGTAGSALLTLIDSATGATFGGVTNGDGTYSVDVPPGSYQMYAEPLNGVVQPVNLYFTPQLTAGSLQSTMMSGTVSVAANSTATANITAASGASALAVPYVGVTLHNGSLSGVPFFLGGPTFVPSGDSVDLLLYGAGFDGTLTTANFTFLGQGVSATAVGLVPGAMAGSFPILRVTLTVAAQQSLSLTSIFVTKGSSTVSLSGALVIGPPAPATSIAGVVNSAIEAPLNGAISPGGLYTVYASPFNQGQANLGAAQVFTSGAYDPSGYAPFILGGVGVTFNGVPAPIFFVNGSQINLQVPFEVAGAATATVLVNWLGSTSAPVTVPVVATQPGFITHDGKATATINPDNSFNSAANPAAVGTGASPSVLTIYGTGVGVLANSPSSTGTATPVPSTFSANGYTCTVGGIASPNVTFAGYVPSESGETQWDVTIPPTLTASGAVPISCTNGTTSTQSGTTVFVH